MWSGFDSQNWRHLVIEFVGSILCTERIFSGYSSYVLFSKTNLQFDLISVLSPISPSALNTLAT